MTSISQPRFSAFILKDTGRRIHGSERPMLDYTLTASTAQYPRDAVVLENASGSHEVGQSKALGDLAQELDGSAMANPDRFFQRTKAIIQAEASGWDTYDDLSQRGRLMQGSEQAIKQESDGAWAMTFIKPPKKD